VTGHCINIESFFLGQAIPNIVTDGILLALPLPLIWDLHLPKGQKMALSGVFLLGSLYVFYLGFPPNKVSKDGTAIADERHRIQRDSRKHISTDAPANPDTSRHHLYVSSNSSSIHRVLQAQRQRVA